MRKDSFDYIIAGGGLAGLSLAFYLNESEHLRGKKVLIIDRDAKRRNDRTWCFWEREPGAFEETVFRRWPTVRFHGAQGFSASLDLGPYSYKMIRAADFYRFVLEKIAANRNFTFLQSEIVSAENGTVNTAAGEFEARELVFESFTRKSYDDPRYRNLFQHFRGWVIETGGAAFDPNEPTLFDFRVAQMNECRFVYILPFSASRALVEFTIFSDNLPDKSVYEENLRSYIENVLGQKNYEILETETGLIPMSDEPHVEFPDAKTIRIGTAGGYVKPSTGYSFTRTQNRLQKLVGKLENPQNQRPKTKDRRPNVWKSYLDSVLLDVLLTKKHAADEVFTALFSKNPAALVLKFLDEETSPAEDLRIMKSVPLPAFSRAALETALKNLRRK